MTEYIELGSTPCGEKCEQTGPGYREHVAMMECRVYIRQLKRIHGDPPEGAYYSVKRFSHDFGSYHEAVINFSDSNEDAIAYSYKVEGDCPEYWDEEARKELGYDE